LGDVALVGAPDTDGAKMYSGAAYIFRKDGSNMWHEEDKLTIADNGSRNEFFGDNVALLTRRPWSAVRTMPTYSRAIVPANGIK
jgi:hypothetical protein